MTETVVHVTTLEQWKSVLDVWWEQGYKWSNGDTGYNFFEDFDEDDGHSYLILERDAIFYSRIKKEQAIEYSEFMAQQKKDNKMAMVYEVSQSVFDELQRIKAHEGTSLIGAITFNAQLIQSIKVGNKAILIYLADDPAIEFKAKEQLYRLWRVDDDGEDMVYMKFSYGTPDWTMNKDVAFTAPLEEIKKWNNPAWEIEKVDD